MVLRLVISVAVFVIALLLGRVAASLVGRRWGSFGPLLGATIGGLGAVGAASVSGVHPMLAGAPIILGLVFGYVVAWRGQPGRRYAAVGIAAFGIYGAVAAAVSGQWLAVGACLLAAGVAMSLAGSVRGEV